MMADGVEHSRYGEGFGYTRNVAIYVLLSRLSDDEQREYLKDLKMGP